jgi:hypothetical protein
MPDEPPVTSAHAPVRSRYLSTTPNRQLPIPKNFSIPHPQSPIPDVSTIMTADHPWPQFTAGRSSASARLRSRRDAGGHPLQAIAAPRSCGSRTRWPRARRRCTCSPSASAIVWRRRPREPSACASFRAAHSARSARSSSSCRKGSWTSWSRAPRSGGASRRGCRCSTSRSCGTTGITSIVCSTDRWDARPLTTWRAPSACGRSPGETRSASGT